MITIIIVDPGYNEFQLFQIKLKEIWQRELISSRKKTLEKKKIKLWSMV